MDANLLFICFLTLVIHIVGTLAYAVRIAGIRDAADRHFVFAVQYSRTRFANVEFVPGAVPCEAHRIPIAGGGATTFIDGRRFSVALSCRDHRDSGRCSLDSNIPAAV